MEHGRMVDRAAQLAVEAHRGQLDKLGVPYILHVARVAASCTDDLEAAAAGWLHDVVEDTDISLYGHEFTDDVIAAVELLSHAKGEPYTDYIRRIVAAHGRAGEIARRVKRADIYDNLGRQPESAEWSGRLTAKYAEALRIMEGTE